jgi:hypothetical protein
MAHNNAYLERSTCSHIKSENEQNGVKKIFLLKERLAAQRSRGVQSCTDCAPYLLAQLLLASKSRTLLKMTTNGADISQSPICETKLPALSPEEFDTFNWMAVRMDYFVSSMRPAIAMMAL